MHKGNVIHNGLKDIYHKYVGRIYCIRMRSGEFYAKRFITHICVDGKCVIYTKSFVYSHVMAASLPCLNLDRYKIRHSRSVPKDSRTRLHRYERDFMSLKTCCYNRGL